MDELTRERFLPGPRAPLDRHDPWAGIEPRSYSLLATTDPQGYPQASRPSRVTFVPWPRGRGITRWRAYQVRRAKGAR